MTYLLVGIAIVALLVWATLRDMRRNEREDAKRAPRPSSVRVDNIDQARTRFSILESEHLEPWEARSMEQCLNDIIDLPTTRACPLQEMM